MITAACVSVSGMIGWVGLVIPTLPALQSATTIGSCPSAMLLGASFLMIVDNFARMLATLEIPRHIDRLYRRSIFLYLILDRGNKI